MRKLLLPLLLSALMVPSGLRASTAYGTLNNFDCVNDTERETHGFDIEMDDVRSTDITYTYNYNHYGAPTITEDLSDPLHPKVRIRYASKKNPDGTWAAYTAIPSGPIAPTQGHDFTNPNINFGGEHFGVGYYGLPKAVRYFWLLDDGTGNLVHGPPVYVATPTFAYYPPQPAAPANVVAVIVPPPPPEPPVLRFGEACWVKSIKTTTHNNKEVKLEELVGDDPDKPQPWANGEPAEVEVEWRLLQTEFANPDNAKGLLEGAPEDLPDGDETITRRYEFYKYTGPFDAESGEAMADAVGPDGVHGVGDVTFNSYFDLQIGEWVEETVDLTQVEVVGEFFGAQMSAFDVGPGLGLIDNLQDGELNAAYTPRTLVIGGTPPVVASFSAPLPAGLTFDPVTGVLSGTPTAAGTFNVTLHATDANGGDVTKTYALKIVGGANPVVPDVAALADVTGQCSATVAVAPTANGGTIVGTTTDPLTYTAEGNYVITWTYTGAGGSASQTQVVRLHDTLAPVPNTANLPLISGQCSATIASTPTATDNCGGLITGTTQAPLTYTTQGDHLVTWSYVDARGNFSLQSQTVRVKDTLAPVPSVASLPDVVGQCSATISAPPTATDNCAGVVTGTTTSPLTYSAQGDYAVVWTYSDGHGQAVTQTQMVRVHDTLAPVPNVASLPTISGSGSVTVTTVPKATDNCSGTVNGTTQSPLTYTTPGTYTITWRYVDAAGNLTTQTQTVVVTSATTATTLTYGGATSATAGGTVALKATLKTSSGTLLAGQTVKFVLGSQTVSAVTTSKGIASASLVLNQAAGSYTVQSSFAGTATYGASSTTTPFTINPKRR